MHADLANEISSCTPDFDKDGVDKNEAPIGFYATLKVDKGYNICRDCDARELCCENKNNWCKINRCMSHEVTYSDDGKTYTRKDGKSVIFKLKTEPPCTQI